MSVSEILNVDFYNHWTRSEIINRQTSYWVFAEQCVCVWWRVKCVYVCFKTFRLRALISALCVCVGCVQSEVRQWLNTHRRRCHTWTPVPDHHDDTQCNTHRPLDTPEYSWAHSHTVMGNQRSVKRTEDLLQKHSYEDNSWCCARHDHQLQPQESWLTLMGSWMMSLAEWRSCDEVWLYLKMHNDLF